MIKRLRAKIGCLVAQYRSIQTRDTLTFHEAIRGVKKGLTPEQKRKVMEFSLPDGWEICPLSEKEKKVKGQ